MNRISGSQLFNSGQLTQGLAKKSVRGGITTLGSQGVQVALRISSTAVLARLLTPADYGLIGMVTVVIGFIEMFKDAGLSMATIQREEITREQISTLFWINVMISAVLGMCVFVCSPLVAMFYGKPELTAVTAVLSISFILSGLTIQHQALLRRHMRFGILASIQISSQVVTLIVSVILACIGWRYWALVGGTLFSVLAGVLLTFFFCPWVPGRMQKGTGVREMLKFGGHLTGFNFITYFSRSADYILIGRFLGADALGLYSRAHGLCMMPINQIRSPLVNVAMPVLSTIKDQPERYIKYYQRIIDILASVAIPLMLYCVFEADFIIGLYLGSQWLGAVPVFRILAIAGLLNIISGTTGLVQLSLGFSARFLKVGIFSAIFYIVAFVVGVSYGIKGMAMAYVIATAILFFPTLLYSYHQSPVKILLVLRTIAEPFLISVLAVICAMLILNIFKNGSVKIHFVTMIVYGLIILGANLLRPSFKETLRLLLQDVLKKKAKA